MTFAARDRTFQLVLKGQQEVECGGRRCHNIVKITENDRENAKMAIRLGIMVFLCSSCKNKIRGPVAA